MKKILAMILALCMVFVLCACGSTAATSSTSTATTSTAASAPDKLKVGLIALHDENSTYDLNFINAFNESCEKLGVEAVVKTNIPEGQECYEAAAELADAGCQIIFADSFGHEDYIIQAAKEFPEVQFCHATGTQAHTAGIDNFHNAFASIYEGRYLAGVAAGLKLQEMLDNGTVDSAKVGYVGAYTYAEVMSGYTSWFLGLRSIVPEATMEVTFTGSWYDETAEKEGAMKLINDGCVLISQHADSMGAPTACETNNIPNVSYNGSTIDACPNTFIVSSRINWSPYYEYAINCVINGEAIDADWTGDLTTESVVLTDINEKVAAAGTAEKLAEVKQGLIDGSIKVFDITTFTVDGKTLDSYLADVDTDAAYEGDTEVISDGAFNESTFRSAPYFDLRIDGISLLDEMY